MTTRKKSKSYSPEVKERAVRLVRESVADHPSEWAAIKSIATKIGCNPETLRKWVREAERDAGERPGPTSDEQARIRELERENRELKRANEILKKASAFFARRSSHPKGVRQRTKSAASTAHSRNSDVHRRTSR
jgi:transposase-like protein